ncbi:Y-family DNA polymerase [Guggenheimella bovis]
MIDYNKLPIRSILCVDVKSFFASIEAARRGIDPLDAYVIVVSDLTRNGSIVLAASPKVKSEFGIRTGSRRFEIPNDKKLMLVEPSMALYIKVNRMIHKIFQSYAADEDIVTYSIDESLIDVTETQHLFGGPYEMALMIRNRIQKELGLAVTVGIGDNPLLAKLALDNGAKHAPNQIAYWSYEDIPNTVWKIDPITDFWGISRGWRDRFQKMGILSIKDLAQADPKILEQRFGIMGLQQYYHANGVDYTRIRDRVRVKEKSFSKGQVLFKDYVVSEEIRYVLEEITDDVCKRLRAHAMHTEEVSLMIGFSDQGGFHASKRIRATDSTDEIFQTLMGLFRENWRGQAVRQIYVALGRLKSNSFEQLELFDTQEGERKRSLDRAIDSLRDRFGKTAVFRASAKLEGSTFFERAVTVGGHKGYSEVAHE